MAVRKKQIEECLPTFFSNAGGETGEGGFDKERTKILAGPFTPLFHYIFHVQNHDNKQVTKQAEEYIHVFDICGHFFQQTISRALALPPHVPHHGARKCMRMRIKK